MANFRSSLFKNKFDNQLDEFRFIPSGKITNINSLVKQGNLKPSNNRFG